MKINLLNRLMLVCITLTFFSSCIKHYETVESEFNQGKQLKSDSYAIGRSSRRAITVYDEFETKASFAALYLNDATRKAYVDLYNQKRGMSYAKKEEMLKRALEENQHWATFYVLADVHEKMYASLSEPNAVWTLSLKLHDGSILVPEKIKEVDLEPEYQTFFGSEYNHLKTAYIVTFPITPAQAALLSNAQTSTVVLWMRSPTKEARLQWKPFTATANHKKVDTHEDFYWC